MTLTDYLKVIQKRWLIVLSVIVAGCLIAALAGPGLNQASYTATSKLIVNKSFVKADEALSQADLQLNIMLINTYKELIKTPPILDEVVRLHPELKLTAEELAASLKVTTTAGSQIMSLSWKDISYERASAIVNAVTEVFKLQLPNLMKVDNVVVLSQANAANKPAPVQTSLTLLLLVGFICSTLLAVLLALLLESLDRRMAAVSVVERITGYPVLVSVQEIKPSQMKRIMPSYTPSFKRAGEEQHVHVNG